MENPPSNIRRDPNHFLERAHYFKNIANPKPETDEYEYVMDRKSEPDIFLSESDSVPQSSRSETSSIIQASRILPRAKLDNRRYYDPTTKHYYKIQDPGPSEKVPQSDVWYPENQLSYKTVYDPDTGEHFNVDKIYNDDGTYKYIYKKIRYRPVKYPGMDHYMPQFV